MQITQHLLHFGQSSQAPLIVIAIGEPGQLQHVSEAFDCDAHLVQGLGIALPLNLLSPLVPVCERLLSHRRGFS